MRPLGPCALEHMQAQNDQGVVINLDEAGIFGKSNVNLNCLGVFVLCFVALNLMKSMIQTIMLLPYSISHGPTSQITGSKKPDN